MRPINYVYESKLSRLPAIYANAIRLSVSGPRAGRRIPLFNIPIHRSFQYHFSIFSAMKKKFISHYENNFRVQFIELILFRGSGN